MIAWGQMIEGQPEWRDLYAPRTSQGRLFVVDDGAVKFPTKSYRVPLINRISAFGFVNDGPIVIDFQSAGLASAEGILFDVACRVTLAAKSADEHLRTIIFQREALYDQLSLTIRNALLPVLAATPYADLKFTATTNPKLEDAVAPAVAGSSPYELKAFVAGFRSKYPEVDEALEQNRAAPTVRTATEVLRQIQDAEATRSREAALAETKHRLGIGDIEASHERSRKRADQEDEIAIEARRKAEALQHQLALVQALPDARDRFTPEQLLQLLQSEGRNDKDRADLNGQIRAVRLLLGQPLLPEKQEHTYRGLPFTNETDAGEDE